MSPVQVNGKPNACIHALGKFNFVCQADRQQYRCPCKLVFGITNGSVMQVRVFPRSFAKILVISLEIQV